MEHCWRREEYERNVRERLGRHSDSELGSDVHKIHDED